MGIPRISKLITPKNLYNYTIQRNFGIINSKEFLRRALGEKKIDI